MASTETLKLLLAMDVQAAGLGAIEALRGSLDGLTESAGGMRPALLGVGLALAGVAAVGATIGEAVKQAADWQTKLTEVQNNTTMTNADTEQMRRTIERLASESPASMDQLAEGYMHVANFGFNAAQSQKILTAAMESAVSTGGNVADTANMLAAAMHEFGIPAAQAANAMDVLHLAAAQGNMTLEQMVQSGGQAMAMAANMGVPLTQAAAAMSALTRHGFDAAMAGTQVKDMIQHLVVPSKATEKELVRLSHATGIYLVRDFSEAGLKAKGLTGVLADVKAATAGNSAEILRLLPNIRGGLAAVTLLGTGSQDYQQILTSLNATMAGKSQPTLEAYTRSQHTLGFVMGELKNNVKLATIALGDAFLPELTTLATWLMTTAIPAIRSFGSGMDWLRGAVGAAGRALAPLGVAIASALPQLGAQANGALAYAQALIGTLQPALQRLGDAVQNDLIPTARAWASVLMKEDVPILQTEAQVITRDLLPAMAGIERWVLGTVYPALAKLAAIISVTVLPIFQQLESFLESLILPAFRQAGAAVLQFTDRVLPRITAVLNNLIIPGVRQLMTDLGALWQQDWQGIALVLQGVWNVIEGIIKIAWAVVSGVILAALDVLSGNWSGAWQDIETMLREVWEAMGQIVEGAGQTILGLIQTLLDTALSLIRGFAPGFAQAGEDLIEGLKQGILSAAGDIANAARSVVENAINAAKAALGIHSPSTVFRDIGQQTVMGFVAGVAGQIGAAQRVMGTLVGAVQRPFGSSYGAGVTGGGGAAAAAGAGITVLVTGNTILNERMLDDLATRVGQVLVQQTRAAYPLMR